MQYNSFLGSFHVHTIAGKGRCHVSTLRGRGLWCLMLEGNFHEASCVLHLRGLKDRRSDCVFFHIKFARQNPNEEQMIAGNADKTIRMDDDGVGQDECFIHALPFFTDEPRWLLQHVPISDKNDQIICNLVNSIC